MSVNASTNLPYKTNNAGSGMSTPQPDVRRPVIRRQKRAGSPLPRQGSQRVLDFILTAFRLRRLRLDGDTTVVLWSSPAKRLRGQSHALDRGPSSNSMLRRWIGVPQPLLRSPSWPAWYRISSKTAYQHLAPGQGLSSVNVIPLVIQVQLLYPKLAGKGARPRPKENP